MKICPNCRRTYDDDGLNFCLEDGTVLTFASADAERTVVMEYPRPTNPVPPSPVRQTWDPQRQPAESMQPKKRSSRTWVWVLGIFAILILVCGGGFVGFFVYVASITDTNSNIARTTTNSRNSRTNTTRTPTPNSAWDDAGDALVVDLSGWVKDPNPSLESEYAGDEFFMRSKQKGYYYVLVAKEPVFSVAGISRVTVRNPDDSAADLGYGLVFHSETTPLVSDFAFLIDTAKKKFRVVRHERENETTVTPWTSSNSIKDQGEPNVLEARNKGDKIELYINDQLATSIQNKLGPKKGVPGLYVGDGAKIGFRKLEVVK